MSVTDVVFHPQMREKDELRLRVTLQEQKSQKKAQLR